MMHSQKLPGVSVRVTKPTEEHQSYQDAVGRIVDVRDFGEHRHCQVLLESGNELIYFEAPELTIEAPQK